MIFSRPAMLMACKLAFPMTPFPENLMMAPVVLCGQQALSVVLADVCSDSPVSTVSSSHSSRSDRWHWRVSCRLNPSSSLQYQTVPYAAI